MDAHREVAPPTCTVSDNQGTPSSVNKITLNLNVNIIAEKTRDIVAAQCFFISRLFLLSKSKWLLQHCCFHRKEFRRKKTYILCDLPRTTTTMTTTTCCTMIILLYSLVKHFIFTFVKLYSATNLYYLLLYSNTQQTSFII